MVKKLFKNNICQKMKDYNWKSALSVLQNRGDLIIPTPNKIKSKPIINDM